MKPFTPESDTGLFSTSSQSFRGVTPLNHSAGISSLSSRKILSNQDILSICESAYHLFQQKRYKTAFDLYKKTLGQDAANLDSATINASNINTSNIVTDGTSIEQKHDKANELLVTQEQNKRATSVEHSTTDLFKDRKFESSPLIRNYSNQNHVNDVERHNNVSQNNNDSLVTNSQSTDSMYVAMSQIPFHYFAMSKCAFILKDYSTAKKDALHALKLLVYQAKYSIMSELRAEHKKNQLKKKKSKEKRFFMTSVNISQNQSKDENTTNTTNQNETEENNPIIQDTGIKLIIGISCYHLKQYEEALQYLTDVILKYQPKNLFEDEMIKPELEHKEDKLVFYTTKKPKKKKGISIYDENDFSFSEEQVTYASENPLFKRNKMEEGKLDAVSAQELERAILFRSKTYSALKRYKDSILDINQLLNIHNDSGYLIRLRGMIRYEMEEYHSAIEDFTKAIEIRKNRDYKAITERGKTYITLQLFDKAMEDLLECLKLQPQYALAWKHLGRVYLQNRQFELAEQALSKTVSLNDGDKESCKLLGDVCMHLGMISRAKLYYHKALLLDHNYDEATQALNEMLELDGKKMVSPVYIPFQNKKQKTKIAIDKSSIRLGLLIGNSTYSNGNHLRTPQSDVISIQSSLYDLNFQCTALINANRNRIMESLNILCERRRQYMNHKVNEGKTSIFFFYFNGHAFQYESRNYIIPIEFRWRNYESMEDMLQACIPLDDIIKVIEEADTEGVNVYVFDCMRPNALIRTEIEEKAYNLHHRNLKKANADESDQTKLNSNSKTSKNSKTKATIQETVQEEEEISESMLRTLRSIKLPKVSISRQEVGMCKNINIKDESIVTFSHLPNTILPNDQGFIMGLFTRILLQHLKVDSLFLDLTGMEHNRALMFKVKQTVQEESFGKQTPWIMSTLSRSVILNKVQN